VKRSPVPHEKPPSIRRTFLKLRDYDGIYPFKSVRVTMTNSGKNVSSAGRRNWVARVDLYVRLAFLTVAIIALIDSLLNGSR